MRRLTLIALFAATGCGGLGGSLTASESALVQDSDRVQSSDDSTMSGIEQPLSGADPTDPGNVDVSAGDTMQAEKLRTNPGRWFTPAGCITTTVSGNTATSVFVDCKGPLGLHTFNGTVVTTWAFGSGSLTITHQATGFHIDQSTVDHDATIVYTKSGTTISRHRSGTTKGTTESGEAIDHAFDYTATYDPTTRCLTRDGSSSSSVGDRAFSMSITGYERCGIGDLGCPKSGTITLSRTSPAPAVSLTLDFPGGASVDITGPKGNTVERTLICNPD